MKCKLITTASDESKTMMLQKSLKKHDWDYHVIIHPWRGFGDKILKTYEYLKANPDITHFFYSDSYDTIATYGMEEALSKIPDKDIILMSAERACYPHPDKEKLYPKHDSPFHFVNGGGWFASSLAFQLAVESNPLTVETNDQVWFTDLFLNNPDYVKLDYNCEVFQTIAFCPDSDFILNYNNLENGVKVDFYNTVTKSFPCFIHGNGHTPLDKFYKLLASDFNKLSDLTSEWKDDSSQHKLIHDAFCEKVNQVPELKKLRDYVESNIFGFGERSFYWLFKLLADTKNYDLKFLEIGVFRGQTLALMRLLKPKAKIYGITPFDRTNDGVNLHWESDYRADVKKIHDDFKLEQPKIIEGYSTTLDVVNEASRTQWDMIYIDGGHSYDVARSDVYTYSSFVKVGGYLIIDDCANKYSLPEGMFRGIPAVSQAVDELLPNEYYKEICSVVHIRVFQRIK
jgi:hypothetical protein